MEVLDITPEHERDYHVCLKHYWDDAASCIDRREEWYERAKGQGLRVKLARDDDGAVAGQIQYMPIEQSFVEGQGLYFVLCIWVHGYAEGIGDRRGKGIGTALLEAAEADARALGAAGMAAWGLEDEEWMNAPWFERHGYRVADTVGDKALVWKPFKEGANPPRWVREHKRPTRVQGKVVITSLNSGWCVSANVLRNTARMVAAEHRGDVVFQEVDTSDRPTMLEWGNSDALYIDGERVDEAEAPTHDELEELVARKVQALRRSGVGVTRRK